LQPYNEDDLEDLPEEGKKMSKNTIGGNFPFGKKPPVRH
jgi:hypothetical protein